MKVKIYDATDTDAGTPFVFTKDDDGKDVVALVGQMPEAEAARIVRKFGKSKVHIRGKKDQEIPIDYEQTRAENVERAIHSLRDTRNFTLGVGGPGMAKKLAELLGEPIDADQDVCFDGKWSPAVKLFILGLNAIYGFAAFVSEKHGELVTQQQEDEEGKDETSSTSSTSASA